MAEEEAFRSRVSTAQLYRASQYLSKEARNNLGLRFHAPIYMQDPEVARLNSKLGIHELELDWEPNLSDGPSSARVVVVDYNADTGAIVTPAKWDQGRRQYVDAENPASFQFHQVNVWAVVQNTLAFFEDPHVMGRPIPWGIGGNRLIVIPHAGNLQNAYYDRRSKSLQFYYFGEPDSLVYTCLSHDIVAHETGHAVLDGIRPLYNEISSAQTSAFHEFLADLTAILSALRINELRQVVAKLSKGDLSKDKVISDLAEEFAKKQVEAVYGDAHRYYLRTANSQKVMKDIEGEWEPHLCSEVLTGAMFEILSELTKRYFEEGESPKESLRKATSHLNRMAFRALDFCPSVDVQFADYVNAVLLADEQAYPLDSRKYRNIVREVFKKRGLEPQESSNAPNSVDFLWKYDIGQISRSRTAAYIFLNDNRRALDIPQVHDIKVEDLYFTDKLVEAEKRLPQEIILTYSWTEDVDLRGKRFGRFEGQRVPLWCGGTLVFDGRGNPLHWSKKPGVEGSEGRDKQEGEQRRGQMLDYIENLIQAGVLGFTREDRLDELDVGQPAAVARSWERGLRLQATPYLHHIKRSGGV